MSDEKKKLTMKLKVIDPVTEVSVTFRDFSNAGEGLKTNLIMPETWPFIGKGLRMCAVIRPIETKGITMGRGHLIDRHGTFLGVSPRSSLPSWPT